MKIIILGAGQVGASVAESLVSEANDITMVDIDPERLSQLQDRLDLRTVVGNASHPSIIFVCFLYFVRFNWRWYKDDAGENFVSANVPRINYYDASQCSHASETWQNGHIESYRVCGACIYFHLFCQYCHHDFNFDISGLDGITAFSAAVACLNNLGPGLGGIGPASTYASLTDLQTWVCSFAMLLAVWNFLHYWLFLFPLSGESELYVHDMTAKHIVFFR